MEILTVKEVAELLKISESHVRRLTKEGMPHHQRKNAVEFISTRKESLSGGKNIIILPRLI
jgi:Mn-dependent DtxR family transcriptional regulator